MNYEYEDFRKQEPLNDPGPWLTWQVPSEWSFRYVMRLAIWMWLIPTIFGFALAPLGFLIQFFVVDYFSYLQYKKTNTI